MSHENSTNASKLCEFPSCGRPFYANGLCRSHYDRQWHGKELVPLRPYRPKGDGKSICSFPQCGRKMKGNRLCSGHWKQVSEGKTLTPLYATQRPKGTPPRLEFDEIPCPRSDLNGPCKIFRGHKTNGYGQTTANGKKHVPVHRYVWEQANGPIPDKMDIDHQCRNRACINVDHLRVVTRQVNITENIVGAAWQKQKAKTHCHRGHEFTEENTLIDRGHRICKACKKKWESDRKERRRAKARVKQAVV